MCTGGIELLRFGDKWKYWQQNFSGLCSDVFVSVLREDEGCVEENAFKCATVLTLFVVPLVVSHSIRVYLIKAGWCQPLSLGR